MPGLIILSFIQVINFKKKDLFILKVRVMEMKNERLRSFAHRFTPHGYNGLGWAWS